MTAPPAPDPSPEARALAADHGLGAHTGTQRLGHPVSTARLAAAAVFTALCAVWVIAAFAAGWGLLLASLGLPFFLMTGVKMIGTVALYRNQRDVFLFDGGVVVVARGRPTAFRWDAMTVAPTRVGDSLVDVRLTGADGSEDVLVAGSFGDGALTRLTGVLQDAVGDRNPREA